MNYHVMLVAGIIFVLRVLGNMLTTLRLITIVHGKKLWPAVLAVFETLIFAIVIGNVVKNLDNGWNLAAYCLGYAVGGYIGQILEQRFIQRFIAIQAISPSLSHEVANAIRESGFGATESWGQGAQGQVGSVTSVVKHHDVAGVVKVIQQVDPEAFIMMEELRGIARGYFRRTRPEQR
jgi:uncharacterized protein YebE (UPF0316 family)